MQPCLSGCHKRPQQLVECPNRLCRALRSQKLKCFHPTPMSRTLYLVPVCDNRIGKLATGYSTRGAQTVRNPARFITPQCPVPSSSRVLLLQRYVCVESAAIRERSLAYDPISVTEVVQRPATAPDRDTSQAAPARPWQPVPVSPDGQESPGCGHGAAISPGKSRRGHRGLEKSRDFQGLAGGANRDRTDDLLNAIQALSQLSYGPAQGGGI